MNELGSYEIEWRPAYEIPAGLFWLAGIGGSYMAYANGPIESMAPCISTSAVCGTMAAVRLAKGYSVWRRKRNLSNGCIEFMSLKDLKKRMNGMEGSVWIGKGFSWSGEVAGRAYDILKRDPEKVVGVEGTDKGAYWLHGVGMRESNIGASEAYLSGHSLVVGTTGAGKTRLFDLMVSQAILRGECVIIIDPKGDKELRDNAKRACEAMGRPELFVNFHPAFPEESAGIDPMRNWNRSTELASRIAALIPSETGADPFTAFGWKAINDVVQGLVYINSRPNLRTIRRFIEGGLDDLVVAALRFHFEKHIKGWEQSVAPFVKRMKSEPAGYAAFYRQLPDAQKASVLDGLVSGFEHNREHFQKMIASLIPILNMLTAEPLDKLLSPIPSVDNDRVITDTGKIINNGMVAYIGLDSLSDNTVGSAIGSILLSDLTAVAGDRYNYGINNRPVNLFIDEAAEVINKPTIQLMNKGRGANFRIVIATQTIADFVARMGDEAQAKQVLANTNNKFTLRVFDPDTQKFISESMPKVTVKTIETQLRDGHASSSPETINGMVGETIKAEDVEAISPAMLSILPNLHYFAQLANGKVYKLRIPVLTGEKKK